MAKLNFKRLSRGVRLLTSHIHSQIQLGLTRLTSAGVEHENLENGMSNIRMTFSFPVAWTSFVAQENTVGTSFVLPPPQELFANPQTVTADSLSYILDSVSFSFDQRAAPYATLREVPGAVAENTQSPELSPHMAFKLAIYSKPLEIWSSATPDPSVTEQVISLSLPNPGFIGKSLRTNPVVAEGLGAVMTPFNSYTLSVDINEWASLMPATAGQVNSITVSLVIKCRLMEKDNASGDATLIQNIPQSNYLPAAAQYGGRYTAPETLTIPAAGSVIKADEDAGVDSGVQGSIEKVDRKFLGGLIGGYNEIGRRFGPSNILDDASYEIIAVPMWGNGWHVGGLGGAAPTIPGNNNVPYLPYVGASPFTGATCDRRIIPIRFPMVIHHVLAFRNYSGGIRPTSAIVNSVGVGIATGNRADSYNNREVAYASWTGLGASYRIDTVSTPDGISGDLLNIPLVSTAATTGTGYDPTVSAGLSVQGRPVYAGQTTTDDSVRSQMADTPGGAIAAFADIDGKEQWLEVRWAFNDPAGLANMNVGETQIGRGGHWVYIIGKKHLN